ncbi:MAG: xanthine dehydrogenase family protein molybdopterin-binding subunit [Chloroflexi bacterium]|nr:xanthine dehydrogenase family protein molybdopterin-binding subunit [Chloroflexota bacterium]MBV9600601.1 xanthine dehydrogenase family protein molybdopterin-binding subunit [Chloroflexota bacterium]
MNRTPRGITRRGFIGGSGALVISFSLLSQLRPVVADAQTNPVPQGGEGAPSAGTGSNGSIDSKQVDSWLSVGQDGAVTIYSGRVELGTGTRTALAQIAADELYVPFESITMVQGDTARAPDEGYTAGSKTIQVGGVNVRNAAATARQALMEMAAAQFGVGQESLSIANGAITVTGNPSQSVTYGQLIGGQKLNRAVAQQPPLKDPSQYTVVGQSISRLDLPPKMYGQPAYVSDLRVPGMLHGRTVHPVAIGATVADVDESSVANSPDLVQVVRNGNFVGVVASSEWGAIQAARNLKVSWTTGDSLPDQAHLSDWLRQQPTSDKQPVNTGDVDAALASAGQTIEATYTQPYQDHASIGPSCAVADVQGSQATIYSSTQGVYPLRGAIAQLLGLDANNVHVVHMEGAGCYGHNGFDDAAGEAALLSQAVGQPVRLQWMRQDEHVWEPHGPAMVVDVRGAVDAQGKVSAWDYQVWTPTHSTRPGGYAANLLPGMLVTPPPPAADNGFGGGDRNAPTNYTFANNRVTVHWLSNSPIRVSALRSLGAMANTFANESFMDELAYQAGIDPVQFRLNHLDDPRAIAVIQAAANQIGWQPHTSAGSTGRGQGFAYARYENTETYVATAVDVSVDASNGHITLNHIVVAHDCGLIINPDGLRNQIEGNVIQSASRAILEQVNFDAQKINSVDWRTYPILRFEDIPQIDVLLLNHPDQPAWGAGEITTLTPPPAIANAIYHATGQRLRGVPLNPSQGAARQGGEGGGDSDRGGRGG